MKRFVSLMVLGSIALFGAGCAPSSQALDQQAPQPEAAAQPNTPVVMTGASADAQVATTSGDKAPTPAPKAPVKKPAPKPATGYVTITDSAFEPQVLAISVGTTVIWTNKSTKNQTVRADGANLYDSGNIPPGTTYKHVFPAVGSYLYYSASNPSLKGTIVVR